MHSDFETKAAGIAKSLEMRPTAKSTYDDPPPSYADLCPLHLRSAGKERSCLKAVYNADGFEDIGKDTDLFYTCFLDPVPEFIAPQHVGCESARKDQHALISTALATKKVNDAKVTVAALLGAGLASPLFFEDLDINIKPPVTLQLGSVED